MNMTRPLALLSSSSLRTITTASLRLATTAPITSTLRNQPTKLLTYYNQHHRYSTTTPSTMSASAQPLLELAKQRRSYYPLGKDLTISTARVEEIVKELVQQVPSSFNSQSNRVVVLFGAEHEKLWDITAEILKSIVAPEQWESTSGKMAMFKAAAGSVLFFEDQVIVNRFQENIPLYADRFPTWSSQSNAMLQYAVWTALEAEGLGANLQHYNPLVDQRVAAEWKVPVDWKLSAQLVFGAKTGEAGPKEFAPLEEKYKSYGA